MDVAQTEICVLFKDDTDIAQSVLPQDIVSFI